MTFMYAGTARGTVSVLRGTLVSPDRMGGDVPENAEDVLEASLKDVDPLVVPEDSKTTIRFVKTHGRKGEEIRIRAMRVAALPSQCPNTASVTLLVLG